MEGYPKGKRIFRCLALDDQQYLHKIHSLGDQVEQHLTYLLHSAKCLTKVALSPMQGT
jgi:hypothetical protein